MATSQNGWRVLTSAPPGKLPWITGRVREGDVYTVFDYYCTRYNAEVEPIIKAHSWGWANRKVRGSSSTSNHASGTAIDLNAPKHGLGMNGTFTKAQEKALDRILDDLGGVIRHGKDYRGRKDPMHAEINVSASKLATVAANIRAGRLPSSGSAVAGGTTEPTVTPASAPEKGIFGMTDIRSAYYAPEQIIQPGTTARIRTAKNSHQLAPAKKGTLVSGSVSFTVFDLPEGQSAEVRLLTRDWKAGRDLWTSERVDIVWGTSGYPNAVSIPVVGKSRNGTDTTEYMLEVRSKASSPIKVAHVKTDVLHS